jgi:hypothetical protein
MLIHKDFLSLDPMSKWRLVAFAALSQTLPCNLLNNGKFDTEAAIEAGMEGLEILCTGRHHRHQFPSTLWLSNFIIEEYPHIRAILPQVVTSLKKDQRDIHQAKQKGDIAKDMIGQLESTLPFVELPGEINMKIFALVREAQYLFECARVCRRWYAFFTQDPEVWSLLARMRWPIEVSTQQFTLKEERFEPDVAAQR